MKWPFGQRTLPIEPVGAGIQVQPMNPPVEIVQTGICKVGKYLHLVHPEMEDRGIKLVSIPSDLEARFNRVRIEWNQIQYELSKYPQTLRRRKRKGAA